MMVLHGFVVVQVLSLWNSTVVIDDSGSTLEQGLGWPGIGVASVNRTKQLPRGLQLVVDTNNRITLGRSFPAFAFLMTLDILWFHDFASVLSSTSFGVRTRDTLPISL